MLQKAYVKEIVQAVPNNPNALPLKHVLTIVNSGARAKTTGVNNRQKQYPIMLP